MADKPIGIFTRIKAFFGTIGMLGAGAFILWAPPKVVEEIEAEIPHEWRIRIGIGFLAFGVLFGLTALFASGASRQSQAVATRLKGLLLVAVAALLLAAIGFTFGRDVYNAWRLEKDGRPATATVLKRYMHQVKKATSYSYSISYETDRDGTQQARIKIDGWPRPGEKVPVLYLPDETTVVLPGEPGDSFLEMIERSNGRWPAIGYAAGALACAVGVLFGLKRFLLGKRVEDEAE